MRKINSIYAWLIQIKCLLTCVTDTAAIFQDNDNKTKIILKAIEEQIDHLETKCFNHRVRSSLYWKNNKRKLDRFYGFDFDLLALSFRPFFHLKKNTVIHIYIAGGTHKSQGRRGLQSRYSGVHEPLLASVAESQ